MTMDGGATEDLEKTVTTIMDKHIVRISDITWKQDKAISRISDRLLEMAMDRDEEAIRSERKMRLRWRRVIIIIDFQQQVDESLLSKVRQIQSRRMDIPG